MKRTVITTIIVAVLASAGLMAFVNLTSADTDELNYAEVRRGSFEIAISGSGELVAEKYVDVMGPNIVDNFNFRAAALKITDMIPEGTIVRKGDYIATLDRTAFNNTLKDEQTNLNNLLSQFELKLIDTAVTLSTLRDDLKNQVFVVEEASLAVDQSLFDPPALQRQAEMEYDRMQRHYEQKRRLYFLNLAQAGSEVRNLKNNLEQQKRKVNDLENILSAFIVKAPDDGMVMYKRDRLGNKIKTGSILHPFNPVVATLPDMSSLRSRTYISEIEVNKVKPGLPVQITVDALQNKVITGYVAGIANIGEQLSNSDSKVFEVLINIEEADAGLKPTMTTSNKIIVKTYNDAVYIPLESLHAGADNVTYVYTRDGLKQLVQPGESNERFVIIENGLEAGKSIFLTTPARTDKFRLAGNEPIPAPDNKGIALVTARPVSK